MALETKCQTPEMVFKSKITPEKILIKLELPMNLDLDKNEAELLEKNLHNVLELVMSKYFYKK